MISSFSATPDKRFDFIAQALKEMKNGEFVKTWRGDAEERIRVVVCDKVYTGGLLEFDLNFLLEEVFGGICNQNDVANTMLLVRKSGNDLVFSWIRLRDLVWRMDGKMMTRSSFMVLQQLPKGSVTRPFGPFAIFLRDEGYPDRALLSFKEYFADSCLRVFQINLDDARVRDVDLGWIGNQELPGTELLSKEELDLRLHGTFSSVVRGFMSTSRGCFAHDNALKDPTYFSQDVFERVVGSVACLIAEEPTIKQYSLLAKISRMIAPLPMCNWVTDIAVQYKAMLDNQIQTKIKQQKESELRDNSGVPFVDQSMECVSSKMMRKTAQLLSRAERAQAEGRTEQAIISCGEASAYGSVQAFRILMTLESEINDSLLDIIMGQLDHRMMHDKDRDFIRSCVMKPVSDFRDEEIVKILQVINGHSVLDAIVEEVLTTHKEAKDAMDSDWMFPEGHDDGECLDD